MVRAVVQLKIPDLVAAGPQSSDDLATSTGVKADPLRRIMRCLVTVGVFTESEDGRFGATPVSECFQDQPCTSCNMALMQPADSYTAFGHLMHTLESGKPAFDHVFNMSRWEQLAQEPERAKLFNAAMQAGTERSRGPIAAAYDFSEVRGVIDVGGGRGTLIAGLLKAHSHLRGTVFDLEAGMAEADAYLTERGVGDQCEIVIGSFFESVPAGHDLYVLKNIVHDWNDEKSIATLASCRRAMGPQARVLIVEIVLPDRAEDSAASRSIFMADL